MTDAAMDATNQYAWAHQALSQHRVWIRWHEITD